MRQKEEKNQNSTSWQNSGNGESKIEYLLADLMKRGEFAGTGMVVLMGEG